MISFQQLKILLFAVGLIAASAFALSCGGSKAQSNSGNANAKAGAPPPVVEVSVTPAISRQLPRFLEATGSLIADEQTDVAPAVGGKVVAVGVDLGSFVQRGAMLVRLDDRDARIRLEQSQAQVAQAEANVRQAQAKIGLRAGQKFDPERVAEVGSSRVALELAEKQLRRFERLIETGDVSRSSYDQQKAQRDQLRQQYDVALTAARQNYAAIETAQAAVDAARTQIATARKAIADAVVTSPIAGYVAERPADLGEYVTTTSRVATIVRTNPLRVQIDIPEQMVSNVRMGQSVSVTTSAYPDRNFAGQVHHVSPSVTPNSRTLNIVAQVENNDNELKPGQFATVRILLPESTLAVLVPARAVRTESGTSRVFVIKDGRAELRLVQLGQADGDLVEIKSGIAVGEAVATSNVEALSDGTVVKQ